MSKLECPDLNLNNWFESRPLEKRKDFKSTTIKDSMTSLIIGRQLICLKLRTSVFAPFLHYTLMLADFSREQVCRTLSLMPLEPVSRNVSTFSVERDTDSTSS